MTLEKYICNYVFLHRETLEFCVLWNGTQYIRFLKKKKFERRKLRKRDPSLKAPPQKKNNKKPPSYLKFNTSGYFIGYTLD